MHQIFTIPQVLRSICDNLDRKSSRATALTCRALLEPSLDSLWYSIDSFEPFICCLPQDTFSSLTESVGSERKFTYLVPSPDFTQDNLQRYLIYYGPRIRRFVSPSTVSRMLSNDFLIMLQLMTDNKPGALAPLAQSVRWQHPTTIDRRFKATLSGFMSLFLGPHVQHLTVAEYRKHPIHKASVHSNLKRIHDQLKEVRLAGSYDAALAQSFFTTYSWDTLRRLSLEAISSEILHHASSLPLLQELSVQDSPLSESTFHQLPPPRSPPGGFPSLCNVLVTLKVATGTVWNIFKYLPPENRVQKVHLTSERRSSSATGQSIIDAIAEYCNPATLQTVVLFEHGNQLGTDGPDAAGNHFDEADAEDPLHIRELEAFSMLEKLSLRWTTDVQLSAKEAYRIPICWPRIRHLDLCALPWLNGRVPAVDHLTILHIIKSCPLIEYLGMRFDTTQIKDLDGEWGEPTFLNLRFLRVGDSPISSPHRVERFIDARFPNIGGLDATYDAPAGIQKSTLLDERWAAVVERLGFQG